MTDANKENGNNDAGKKPDAGKNAAAAAADAGKGGPAGNDPAAAAAAANKPAADGAAAEGGDGAAAAYRPDGLPDHLYGKTDQETIDKLKKAVDGFREAQSKGKDIPAKPEDYKLGLGEEIEKKILKPGADGKDPVFGTFQKIAHDHGIPQPAFSAMVGEVFKKVQELQAAGGDGKQAAENGGEGLPPADFEFKELGGVAAAKPVQDSVGAWIKGLQNMNKLDEREAFELNLMAAHGIGLRVLNKLRELSPGERAIPINLDPGGSADEPMTEEKLKALVKDPRYNKKSKYFDPQFHADTTKKFQEFYNKKPTAA